MDLQETQFDYQELSIETREFVKGKELSIKARGHKDAQTILENGKDILSVRDKLPWNRFESWFENDLGMKFIKVRKFGKNASYPCELVIDFKEFSNPGTYVYSLIDYRDGNVFYVGKTRDLLTRLRGHCIIHGIKGRLEKRKHDIHSDGFPVLCFVFMSGLTDLEADKHEQVLIDQFSTTICNVQMNKWAEQERKYV